MYEDAMRSIHDTLIRKSLRKKLTYTAELIPERQYNGEMYVILLRATSVADNGP
jgi:mannosyl-oligosaccharide alpha-1,2-mannosidase